MAGPDARALLVGSLVVETIFAWPGVGQLTVASVPRREDPVLLVMTLFVGIVMLGRDRLADVTALDPGWSRHELPAVPPG